MRRLVGFLWGEGVVVYGFVWLVMGNCCCAVYAHFVASFV